MSALLALLAACAAPADQVAYAEDTAGAPIGACDESGRSPVEDPTAAADGFDFAAEELLAATMGRFVGPVDYPSGRVTTSLTLEPGAGGIEAVYFGEPGEPCAPHYEVHGAGTLIAGDLYAQLLDVLVVAPGLEDVSFTTAFPADGVNGTAAPDALATGADLALAAALGESGWSGSLDWVTPGGDAEAYARFVLPRVAE